MIASKFYVIACNRQNKQNKCTFLINCLLCAYQRHAYGNIWNYDVIIIIIIFINVGFSNAGIKQHMRFYIFTLQTF